MEREVFEGAKLVPDQEKVMGAEEAGREVVTVKVISEQERCCEVGEQQVEEALVIQLEGPMLELHLEAVASVAGLRNQSHSHYPGDWECWEMCCDYPGQCP